jgi:hypothetical protein
MSWLRTIIYSLVLSFAFFLYFGNFVADSWALSALAEVRPRLIEIKENFGLIYAIAFGQTIAFIVGFLATLVFIFPLGIIFKNSKQYTFAAILIILPVTLLDLTNGGALSPSWIANFLQPVIGAIVAVAAFPKKNVA